MATSHIHELKRVLHTLRGFTNGATRLLSQPESAFDFNTYTDTCAFYDMPRNLDVPPPVAPLCPTLRQLDEMLALADVLVAVEQQAVKDERALRGRTRRYKMRMLLRSCIF